MCITFEVPVFYKLFVFSLLYTLKIEEKNTWIQNSNRQIEKEKLKAHFNGKAEK